MAIYHHIYYGYFLSSINYNVPLFFPMCQGWLFNFYLLKMVIKYLTIVCLAFIFHFWLFLACQNMTSVNLYIPFLVYLVILLFFVNCLPYFQFCQHYFLLIFQWRLNQVLHFVKLSCLGLNRRCYAQLLECYFL